MLANSCLGTVQAKTTSSTGVHLILYNPSNDYIRLCITYVWLSTEEGSKGSNELKSLRRILIFIMVERLKTNHKQNHKYHM